MITHICYLNGDLWAEELDIEFVFYAITHTYCSMDYSHGSDLIKQRASLVWLLDAVWVSLTAEGAGGQIWPGESSFQDHTPLFPPLPPLPCLPSQLT